MIDNIISLIVSFALCAGYIVVAGAALWTIGIALIYFTDKPKNRRVRKDLGWV